MSDLEDSFKLEKSRKSQSPLSQSPAKPTRGAKKGAKKLSKIFSLQAMHQNELNTGSENSNSADALAFRNAAATAHEQYIQSQLEGVTCKRKRKRILNRLQRAEATMREKRRMLKLNKAFEELRKVLPVSDFAKNKLSRAETLKSAIEYIENMSELLSI